MCLPVFAHYWKGRYVVYNEINGMNNESSAGILLLFCLISLISKPEDVS